MQIVPVLDLKDGVVVHAKKGQRESYQAITSKLYKGSDPQGLIIQFIKSFALNTFYIADLNAISNAGDHFQLFNNLIEQFPDTNFYIDAGLNGLSKLPIHKNCIPVLGTENNIDCSQLRSYQQRYSNLVLSLDFTETGFWGNDEILNCPQYWPDKIILMNLDQVGSETGLQLKRLQEIKNISKDNELYYAGGITNKNDLEILKHNNIKGVLLASALHNASIRPEDLRNLNN